MKMFAIWLYFIHQALGNLICATDFLNGYNIDSAEKPRFEPMILCQGIAISCCTPFDEMKFHKFWFNFYEKKLNVTNTRILEKYMSLKPLLAFFDTFSIKTYESIIDEKTLPLLNETAVKMSALKPKLDPKLRPVENYWKIIQEFDTSQKKSIICIFCDARNQEHFLQNTYNRLLVNEKRCSVLIGTYKTLFNMRAKYLSPYLLLAHKVISLFNFTFYNNDRLGQTTIKKVRKNMDLINKCFPDINSAYNFTNCKDLCEEYSITGASETFAGEVKFFDYLQKRFNRFTTYLTKIMSEKPKSRKSPEFVAIIQHLRKQELHRPIKVGRHLMKKREGRILSSDIVIKRKISRAMSDLKRYKKIVRQLKEKDSKSLRKVVEQSRKLAAKSRRFLKSRQAMKYAMNPYSSFNNLGGFYPYQSLRKFTPISVPFMSDRRFYKNQAIPIKAQNVRNLRENVDRRNNDYSKRYLKNDKKFQTRSINHINNSPNYQEERRLSLSNENTDVDLNDNENNETNLSNENTDVDWNDNERQMSLTNENTDVDWEDNERQTSLNLENTDIDWNDDQDQTRLSFESTNTYWNDDPDESSLYLENRNLQGANVQSGTSISNVSGSGSNTVILPTSTSQSSSNSQSNPSNFGTNQQSRSSSSSNESTQTSNTPSQTQTSSNSGSTQTSTSVNAQNVNVQTTNSVQNSQNSAFSTIQSNPVQSNPSSSGVISNTRKAPDSANQKTPSVNPITGAFEIKTPRAPIPLALRTPTQPKNEFTKNDTIFNSLFNLDNIFSILGNNNLDLDGNFNCNNCTNVTATINSKNMTSSFKVLLSVNISNSSYVFNSTNISLSINVTNSHNISRSRNIFRSRNVSHSSNSEFLVNSDRVRNSSRCINCTNCINCSFCVNVTNGKNVSYVSNSFEVENIFNGSNLTYVSDSSMVFNIYNGSKLVNASNCTVCNDNFNCTGGECNITKFAKELNVIVNKKLREQQYQIIDQLYYFYRIGSVNSYLFKKDVIDYELYHSLQSYFDLSKRSVLFTIDGIHMNYPLTSLFEPNPDRLKEKALQYLLKNETVAEDFDFMITRFNNLNKNLTNFLNEQANLDFLDDFNNDLRRIPIEYKYMAKRSDDELHKQSFKELILEKANITEGSAENDANSSVSGNKTNATITGNQTNGTVVGNKVNSTNLTSNGNVIKPKMKRSLKMKNKKNSHGLNFKSQKAKKSHFLKQQKSRRSRKLNTKKNSKVKQIKKAIRINQKPVRNSRKTASINRKLKHLKNIKPTKSSILKKKAKPVSKKRSILMRRLIRPAALRRMKKEKYFSFKKIKRKAV